MSHFNFGHVTCLKKTWNEYYANNIDNQLDATITVY